MCKNDHAEGNILHSSHPQILRLTNQCHLDVNPDLVFVINTSNLSGVLIPWRIL